MRISLENKNKTQILEEFIDVCHQGTSRDCMIFVNEDKRHGVSYEELCEYKRIKENEIRSTI
jgi:hypothetical protein